MITRHEQMTSGGLDSYANFIGDDTDYRDWLGFIGQSRDSGCLERSNFEVACKALAEVDPDENDWRTERFGHWAVGWIEEVYVRPGTKAAELAQEIRDGLENYPVLDDQHFSELEHNEATEVWERCYDDQERLEYIREHRSQFDFHDFGDMLACVRGRYFAGYASELLH